VPGVRVGHCTVSWGGPELPHGSGPARTGVTAVFPHGGDLWRERVVAGAHAANGVGEIIGISAVREWGLVETPVLLTNSQSAGGVYDATIRWLMEREPLAGVEDAVMPVVGECDDGFLNDLRGMRREEHVRAALDTAADGPVAEGCVGAGTGMSCYDFKAGIGTSSRLVSAHGRAWTVGVLALTNFGVRHRLSIDGVPVGREIADLMPLESREGSCIVVLATDAPLSSRQCGRLAKRCAFGLAATGSYASDGSGEIMLAFTTAIACRAADEPRSRRLGDHMCGLFEVRRHGEACATLWPRRPPSDGRQHRLRAPAGAPGRRPAASWRRRGRPGRSPALPRLPGISPLTRLRAAGRAVGGHAADARHQAVATAPPRIFRRRRNTAPSRLAPIPLRVAQRVVAHTIRVRQPRMREGQGSARVRGRAGRPAVQWTNDGTSFGSC
jgi:D-aminopeptidase